MKWPYLSRARRKDTQSRSVAYALGRLYSVQKRTNPMLSGMNLISKTIIPLPDTGSGEQGSHSSKS